MVLGSLLCHKICILMDTNGRSTLINVSFKVDVIIINLFSFTFYWYMNGMKVRCAPSTLF